MDTNVIETIAEAEKLTVPKDGETWMGLILALPPGGFMNVDRKHILSLRSMIFQNIYYRYPHRVFKTKRRPDNKYVIRITREL